MNKTWEIKYRLCKVVECIEMHMTLTLEFNDDITHARPMQVPMQM